MATLFGWDSSDFDHGRGPMDMVAARNAGLDFFTHKATEGVGVTHHPGQVLAAARDAGIPFLGAYIVPRSGPTVAAQVDYLLNWMNIQAPWWPEFPGWFWQVDTEHWPYDAVTAQRGHDVAQLLAARTSRVVAHYAPEWAYGNGVPAGEPLWASSYAAGSGSFLSLYPGDGSTHWHAYSGRTPDILQYTSSAIIARQPGCDANAFRGTQVDFAALIGAAARGADMDLNAIGEIEPGLRNADVLADIWRWTATARGLAPVAADGTPLPRTDDRFNSPTAQGTLYTAMKAVTLITDAQLDTIATKLTDALVASNANGLTDADHTAVKADLAAVLATLTLHAG